MRNAKALWCLLLAGAFVTGCSGTGPVADGEPAKKKRSSPTAAPLTEISAPSGYRATEGWQQKLTWLPENARTVPVAASVPAGKVAYLTTVAEAGYAVQVRDAATGRIEWTGKPWVPPTPLSEVTEASSFQSDDPELPGVTTVHQDGRDYVVAWAHGVRGKDELNSGKELVELQIFPLDASGENVAPAHRVAVPLKDEDGSTSVNADPDDLEVSDGGAGLVLHWDGYATYSASVDMASGKVTSYGNGSKLGTECDTGTCTAWVAATTAGGPVAVSTLNGGFGVPKRWSSQDVTPDGAATGHLRSNDKLNGDVVGTAGTHLVAEWTPKGEDQGGDRVWSVHDSATGRVQASTSCSPADVDSQGSRGGPRVATSADGRYVAYGSVVFDLREHKGVCLAGDTQRKGILVSAVRDDGIAYGTVPAADTDGTVAQVRVADGRAEALPAGTELPLQPLKDSGLFVTRNNGAGLLVTALKKY
ncbi:hypothetical protein C3486_11905 [Streptomyces sp. Ru73]|uniref:hypothetical protein n=1 Tax=Streptomyces sp. Ru73 TaxID=2080748 RepID=UPI000CDD956A|nr:hypothetical protein [Streptomyces sp. Ru73]POX40888.1 hypothetical protein C3486_11905 [Streptomyces sp. Ru73]